MDNEIEIMSAEGILRKAEEIIKEQEDRWRRQKDNWERDNLKDRFYEAEMALRDLGFAMSELKDLTEFKGNSGKIIDVLCKYFKDDKEFFGSFSDKLLSAYKKDVKNIEKNLKNASQMEKYEINAAKAIKDLGYLPRTKIDGVEFGCGDLIKRAITKAKYPKDLGNNKELEFKEDIVLEMELETLDEYEDKISKDNTTKENKKIKISKLRETLKRVVEIEQKIKCIEYALESIDVKQGDFSLPKTRQLLLDKYNDLKVELRKLNGQLEKYGINELTDISKSGQKNDSKEYWIENYADVYFELLIIRGEKPIDRDREMDAEKRLLEAAKLGNLDKLEIGRAIMKAKEKYSDYLAKKEDNVSKETNEVRDEPQVITSSPNTQAYDDNYINGSVTSQLDMSSVQPNTTSKEEPMSLEEEDLQYAISNSYKDIKEFFPAYSEEKIMEFYKTTIGMTPAERAMTILVMGGQVPEGLSISELNNQQLQMLENLIYWQADITAALDKFPAEYMAAKQANANTQNAYQMNNAEVKTNDNGMQR